MSQERMGLQNSALVFGAIPYYALEQQQRVQRTPFPPAGPDQVKQLVKLGLLHGHEVGMQHAVLIAATRLAEAQHRNVSEILQF